MKKTFMIKGFSFEFDDDDIKKAEDNVGPGVRNNVKLYTKRSDEQIYPVRRVGIEMTRQKGHPIQEMTAHEAIRITRPWREIIELNRRA